MAWLEKYHSSSISPYDSTFTFKYAGAHLLLFFLAFVFGSFCTFCFHMLMYLFDEKCVLFPKLLSLTSLRHNVIYEFMPSNKDLSDMPVDFVSTQWVEKSTCSLPTYVPLVSGIFGLVWTTMFLMCSTGTRTLTGLQRPWRVLPPVFIFSLAMSILCIYSSAVTHYGLQELCVKLGEITGSSTCSYAVNVVTLAYERRIRGVYQATRLTIISAWLHTACWLCSALLAIIRVVLAVDFQLVRIRVTLHADIDKLMERNETHLRTISPDYVKTKDESAATNDNEEQNDKLTVLKTSDNDPNYQHSSLSLVPDEQNKIARNEAYQKVPKDKQFIVEMLYNILDTNNLPPSGKRKQALSSSNSSISHDDEKAKPVLETLFDMETFIKDIVRSLIDRLDDQLLRVQLRTYTQQLLLSSFESFIIDPNYLRSYDQGMKFMAGSSSKYEADKIEDVKKKKSNLKDASAQTENEKKESSQKHVLIIYERESVTSESDEDQQSQSMLDKETQPTKKEKQD